jgi:hypothetical protein
MAGSTAPPTAQPEIRAYMDPLAVYRSLVFAVSQRIGYADYSGRCSSSLFTVSLSLLIVVGREGVGDKRCD